MNASPAYITNGKKHLHFFPMTTQLWDRLREARKAKKMSQADLAEHVGLSRVAVGLWETANAENRTKPNTDQLRTVAKVLGVSLSWLIEGTDSPVSPSDATAGHIPRSSFRRVPVVGTASLGMDGYWTDLEYPKGQGDGYFEFPTTDRDAYVLQVRGGSMHPAIRSGWYVVIEPNKSPQMGEFVMVKLVDGRSTVKEFLWHRDGEYVLNAISTGERLVIAEDDIEAIHHVGGILPPSGRQA
ncbi:XRE family transcriptional regulator [Luteibacter sp. SG786]|uniref:XRE family transcriptional regulator n=1 Tax=Luteibacter sp. SG786 TaxID=2587130 RepID=UPI0031B88476